MRVLVFFNHDPGLYGILPAKPSQIVAGGYKRFIELAKRLGEFGVNLDVVESFPSYQSDGSLNYEFSEFTVPALNVANMRITDPWLVAWKMARIGKKLSKEKHFDLILSPSEILEMCLAAFLVSHETKIAWVTIVHHLNLNKPLLSTGSSSFKQLVVNSYVLLRRIPEKSLAYFLYNDAYIISVSKATKSSLRKIGITSDIFICGNGLDLFQIDSIASDTCIYDGIFIGRFVPGKGIFEALKIFEKICSERPYAKFALVGGGDEKIVASVKAEITAKKLGENIFLWGYVDDVTKVKLLKSSRLFIYPSHVEGWGIELARR